MKREGHSEVEVRVSFEIRDTLSILYHFEAHFGAQRDQVLDLQRLGCQFGGSFGVLNTVQFEVSR